MTIFDRIEPPADRPRNRFGRDWDVCRTCDRQTRSNRVGDGFKCHSCYSSGRQVLIADGGIPVESEPVGHDRAHEAFEAAISFFQKEIARDLPGDDGPATPLDYYQRVRGWDRDTIRDKRLGWAPASDTALLDHLRSQGYNRDEILGTGLFYPPHDKDGNQDPNVDGDPYPHFRGRYVLPYLDEDGRPLYAISRSADHPGDHHAEQKYTKAIKTKDYSKLDEPIFGLSSIEAGEPVLITEGIADAITAHQQGYPCISPVTTRFKQADRKPLLEVLNDHDVPRLYIIQDAERPRNDLNDDGNGWADLTVEQYGEGVRGAVDTAEYLVDNDVETRICMLPRPGLDKLDLDDYLSNWADSLAPVIASAKPPQQHPAFEPANSRSKLCRNANITAKGTSNTDSESREWVGDDASAVFDLDIVDIAPVEIGYRGPNPLGHHGRSEDYFVVLEEGRVGHDHKYNATYNGVTYLLCEIGERNPEHPEGTLSGDEALAAWLTAKERGHISDEDPIPRTALVHYAVDRGHCDPNEIEDNWRLPRGVYNATLDGIRDEFGIDPGRDPLSDGVGGYSINLPLGVLRALDRDELRRYARKRGLDWPSDSEVSNRIGQSVLQSFRDGGYTVVQAPTAGNKTGVAAETKWSDVDAEFTGGRPVVMFNVTRSTRDAAISRAEAAGLDVLVLRARDEICPVAAGKYDPGGDLVEAGDTEATKPFLIDDIPISEWIDEQVDDRGRATSLVHSEAEQKIKNQGRKLPCCRGSSAAESSPSGRPKAL